MPEPILAAGTKDAAGEPSAPASVRLRSQAAITAAIGAPRKLGSMPTAPVLAAASNTDPGGFAGWAVDVMDTIGSVGAGAAVAAENLFPPIPSEVVLPLAGFAAAQGRFSVVEAIVWTTIGSVVGAAALYGLGAWLGRDRLLRLAARLPLVDVTDVAKGEAWFAKYGGAAVFLGRMVPIVRSVISVPAGVERMTLWRFLLYTAAGSLIWNTIFVLAGYKLGANWYLVEQYAAAFQTIIVVAVLVAIIVWTVRRVRRRRAPVRAGGS